MASSTKTIMSISEAPLSRSSAVTRTTSMTGKIFGSAVLLSGIETVTNALGQLPYLDPTWAPMALKIFIFSQVFAVLGPWFMKSPVIAQRIHAFVVLALLITWPLQVHDPSLLPVGYTPWIWWAIALSAISAGLSTSRFFSALYFAGVPIMWFFLRQLPIGGSATVLHSAQDAIYAFLVSCCVSIILVYFRGEASLTDAANQAAAEAEVHRAEIDAIEQERARVDALIHDKVLTALLMAANGTSQERVPEVRRLAADAIEALVTDEAGAQASGDTTVYALFGALLDKFKPESSGFKVTESGASDLLISAEVASALSEATIQAAANSLQHAGSNANHAIHLKGYAKGVKIVIVDDGRGFRPARVPKNRLGLRLSIIDRVEAVGGRVFIDSKPGKGATIILEWSSK